jgi:hypothetical protein
MPPSLFTAKRLTTNKSELEQILQADNLSVLPVQGLAVGGDKINAVPA